MSDCRYIWTCERGALDDGSLGMDVSKMEMVMYWIFPIYQ